MIRKVCAAATIVVYLAMSTQVRAEPKDDIAALTNEWVAAFSEHNVDRILALYSKDALLWGTNATSLRTTPAEIKAFYQSAFHIPNITVKLENETIRVFGNVAIAAGNYTFTGGSGDRPQSRPSRYSFTFVKEGERWLIVDHNSSPLPGATGPTRKT